MTNEQIIFEQGQRLAEAGLIAYTGRQLTVETIDGHEITIKETEPIHTFNWWKEHGLKVKKGEHAIAKFLIWKHSGAKQESLQMEDGTSMDYIDHGKMFMKMSAFFKKYYAEHKEKCQARNREYYRTHRDECIASHNRRVENNREYHNAYQRKWRADNPDKAKAIADRCAAKKKAQKEAQI